MSLSLVTGPTVLPLHLNEVKAHLRIEDTQNDEDALIMGYLRAAVDIVDGRDGWLGRALCTQTWDLSLDEFPVRDFIRLPLPPVQSITSVKYTDADGVEQTFASSKYSLSADTHIRPRVILAYDEAWPGTRDVSDAVTIRFVAGYGTQNDVPEAIRIALMITVAHWYENRQPVVVGQTVAEMPGTARALLAPYMASGFA